MVASEIKVGDLLMSPRYNGPKRVEKITINGQYLRFECEAGYLVWIEPSKEVKRVIST